jgi:hypothetical protein
MNSSIYRRGLLATLAALCLGCVFAGAAAAATPYKYDPVLSLTGNCNESGFDPIPDPSCPYPPPPGGPSGRFNEPRSIAVDSFGNEYVASYAGDGTKGRIDVFDDEGKFITELLDPNGPQSVGVDSEGNLYAFEQVPGTNGEIVRYAPTVYKPESGEIAYGNPRALVLATTASNGGIALDPSNDHLYLTFAGNSILEYSSAAEGNKPVGTITNEKLHGNNWAGVDGQRRRLFASYCKEGIKDCGVLVFNADAPYELLKEIDGSNTPAGEFLSTKGWLSIAVDEETGNFFIDDLEQSDNVYVFDENYEYVETITSSGFQGGNALQIAVSNASTAFNHRFLFVPVVIAAGRAIAFAPPGVEAPEIKGETADNISETEAEARATIAANGADTEYVFEYVTEAQFEAEGFANSSIGGEGTVSGASLPQQVVALLKGLVPGTSYRFRVVAKNEVGEDEAEGTFTTYADASTTDQCPNQALRTGLSVLLPDCRAYELVTPADMNGRPPKGIGFSGDRFSTVETSPSGSTVSFLTEGGALPGMGGSGAFDGDLYRSVRGSSGWTTATAGPSGDEASLPLTGSTSPDQGFAFWRARGEGSAVVEEGAHYIRYPDGHSTLVGRGNLGTDPQARGLLITENGGHIVFQTEFIPNVPPVIPQRLEENAPPTGTEAVYDRTADEVTHVVSLLPGDVTPAAGQDAAFVSASPDGEGIAFSIGNTLYLRVGNVVTYEIGESVTFAGISEGGERIFYVEGGDLLAFDTTTKETVAFSETGDVTPVNVAPDGSRAYFVSPSVLGGENPNGAVAQAGKENLYLSDEGVVSFVATVTTRDVEGELNSVDAEVDGLGLWTVALATNQLARDPSRLTPDGSVLLFSSRADLDGFDPNGFPQIYRYDSAANRLHCISCNPTKATPSSGASLETFAAEQLTSPPFSIFGFVSNLTSGGGRAFFESEEALVSTDTDDVKDIYEWEENGTGSCERAGGCVYLISSGQSTRENFLYAVSRSGDDVFFITEDVLVPGDESTLSIYDARVGGGFPVTLDEECIGEGCKAPLTPPPALTPPGKPAAGAEDNVKPAPKPRTCPKGKRKVKRHGKVRCVKKHHKKQRNKASTNGRAAR